MIPRVIGTTCGTNVTDIFVLFWLISCSISGKCLCPSNEYGIKFSLISEKLFNNVGVLPLPETPDLLSIIIEIFSSTILFDK